MCVLPVGNTWVVQKANEYKGQKNDYNCNPILQSYDACRLLPRGSRYLGDGGFLYRGRGEADNRLD